LIHAVLADNVHTTVVYYQFGIAWPIVVSVAFDLVHPSVTITIL